jgi:hypothetical protein
VHFLQIVFDYPSEILTHIVGSYGPLMYMGPSVIKSLTFYTNKGKYGPYGEEQGSSFTTKLKAGKIAGIHGRKGLFIDALGVHVIEGKVMPLALAVDYSPSNASMPYEPPISEVDNPQWSNKLVLTKKGPIEEVIYNHFLHANMPLTRKNIIYTEGFIYQ